MSTSDSNCNVGASKSSGDGVCDVNDKLENMNIGVAVSICANCGKEDAKNICSKCKQVKYCNAVCKKVHKKKHKKECEELIKLATEKHNEELRIAAELHDIELFKQPPPKEDCPLCFLRIPALESGSRYYECCGKVICCGCVYAPVYDNQGNEVEKKCPFCRSPASTSGKMTKERMMERVEANDPNAINTIGCNNRDGRYGFTQDYTKALELLKRAAELGHAEAYLSIGCCYHTGQGIEVDMEKAIYYWELAAMKGDETARHNLGSMEDERGNVNRALKHYMISARNGYADSLNMIKEMYNSGHATKDDYTKALQLYRAYLGEIKSPQRDKAAAAREEYRYYYTNIGDIRRYWVNQW